MKEIDFFNFEDKDKDVPFYNNNPKVSINGWILLFFAFLFGTFFVLLSSGSIRSGLLGCIILLIPVLYLLDWDYKVILRKPTAREILLAIGLFIGYVVYTSIFLKIVGVPILVGLNTENFMSIPPLIFSLMGEELIKFIPFVFLMTVFFKFSNNRKLSMVLSVILTLILFAFLHTFNIVQMVGAIFIQGLGSMFQVYGYLKTKNLWVSYISHLCTDVFFISLALLGFNF